MNPFEDPLNPVSPVRPVAPWLGGKRNLAKRITAILDATPHGIYAEPFVGMGGDFIRRYDSAGTLFYLDPPYWGCEGDYGKDLFAREDFERLADQLAGLKGKWLMSMNNVEPIREIFGAFHQVAVETTYSIGKEMQSRGKRGELLIGNFGWV